MSVTQDILRLLEKGSCEYELLEHDAVYTSEEASKSRGTTLEQGAKALVWKGEDFVMTVASAAKRIDEKKLAQHVGEVQLARPKDVRLLTECNIGSVPPFGNLFGIRVVADHSLFENEWIAFNAGSHTTSIKMKSDDYRKIVSPEVIDISQNS